MSEDIINIPKFSLTAFRLTYSTPEAMHRSSQVLLLGGIPDLWHRDDSPGLIATSRRYMKNKIKKQYRSASSLVSRSIHRGSGVPIQYDESEDSLFNPYQTYTSKAILDTADIIQEVNEFNSEQSESEDDLDWRQGSHEDVSNLQDREDTADISYRAHSAETPPEYGGTEKKSSEYKYGNGKYFKPQWNGNEDKEKTDGREDKRSSGDVFSDDIGIQSVNSDNLIREYHPNHTLSANVLSTNEEPKRDRVTRLNGSNTPPDNIPTLTVAEEPNLPSIQESKRLGPDPARLNPDEQSITPNISGQDLSRASTRLQKSENTLSKRPSNVSEHSIISSLKKFNLSNSLSALHRDKRQDSVTHSDSSSLKSHTLKGDNNLSPLDSTLQISEISSLVNAPSAHVRFSEGVEKHSSRVSITKPMPTDPLEIKDLDWIQKEHKHFVKKIRTFTRSSRGKKSRSKIDFRKRLNRAMLKKFKAGEILRVLKVLVLTKEVLNCSDPALFTDNENADTRVHERWSEYLAVLRKTSSQDTPTVIQFYDLLTSLSSTKKKPSFQIPLSTEVYAHLYSDLDKAFCVVAKKRNRVFAYILKPHSLTGALKFLYFLKNTLGHKMNSVFQISIPDIEVHLSIKIPQDVLSKISTHRTQLSITVLPKGYSVEYTPIIQYLKERVVEELKSRRNAKFDKWLETHLNLWFCFKFYDRLEWVQNNSDVFYVQNLVLSSRNFQLELREVTSNTMHTIQGFNSQKQEEPIPVEGFLMRMTNTAGRQTSLLRAFHRLLYFYTCDNLLLFTKFYNAVPPSPNNAFLREEGDLREILKNLPEMYVHSSYEIDENDHIPWLDGENFQEHDRFAIEELERRALQIIKAEAAIDLSHIKDIRPIPLDRLNIANRLFFAYCWYSSTEIITEESIVDSGFEIEIFNGSTITLQAPNRAIRDEWIKRLWELQEYWLAKRQEELQRLMHVRDKNIEKLRINEYVDSNAVLESNLYEIRNSFTDPFLHNIDSIAMTRSVLFNGYLFVKGKKHTDFRKLLVILCPGFLTLFLVFERTTVSGIWKKTPCLSHYLTIPISQCYIYLGNMTAMDLLERNRNVDPQHPERRSTPRLYLDGWKSSEEELMRCFTLWVGRKRHLNKQKMELDDEQDDKLTEENASEEMMKNPGIATIIKRLGLTGRSIVFMARSRQEREIWTYKILTEIDRFY